MAQDTFDPDDLYTILSDQLGVDKDKITLDDHLKDRLGADSLDAVEIVMALEEKYKIEIPEEVAKGFAYVRDIANYLTERRP